MEKKSDTVRKLVTDGDYRKALSIVKGFRLGISKEDLDQMTRAYECMVNPGFYEQLGKDVEFEISEGVKILKTLYGPKEAA